MQNINQENSTKKDDLCTNIQKTIMTKQVIPQKFMSKYLSVVISQMSEFVVLSCNAGIKISRFGS